MDRKSISVDGFFMGSVRILTGYCPECSGWLEAVLLDEDDDYQYFMIECLDCDKEGIYKLNKKTDTMERWRI